MQQKTNIQVNIYKGIEWIEEKMQVSDYGINEVMKKSVQW